MKRKRPKTTTPTQIQIHERGTGPAPIALRKGSGRHINPATTAEAVAAV
jgi:hypothetical protein